MARLPPGILVRPLEDRNVIEMCSVTALAHLGAAVLFILDVSGSCGYTIAQQAALFHSIKSLFMDKPLIIVCNKTDLQPLEGISQDDMKLVMEMKAEAMKTIRGEGGEPTDENGVLLTMSALTENGVADVKKAACQRLLVKRVEAKMKWKKLIPCENRWYVATPQPHDQIERPSCIPPAVLREISKMKTEALVCILLACRRTISLQIQSGKGIPCQKFRTDTMCDFIDRDILMRLEELEREVESDDDFEMDGAELTPKEAATLAEIRKKKSLLIQQHRINKSTAETRPVVPRRFDKDNQFTTERMGRELSSLGLDPSMAINRARSKSRGRKRKRLVCGDEYGNYLMEVDGDKSNKKMRLRSRSRSVSRSKSRPPGVVSGEGFRDPAQKAKAIEMAKGSSKKRNKESRRGESDRVVPTLKPKHLFSGKRDVGKTRRR
ncbi:hypothetical protein OROHE_008238 [Orobanche hederae]